MKIAIITPVFPPYRGGIGSVAARQASAFSRSGDEVTVFTPDWHQQISSVGYKLKLVRPLFRFGNAAILPALIWKLWSFDKVIFHYPFFGSAELLLFRIVPKDKLTIFYHMDVFGKGWLAAFFKFHTRFILPKIISRAGKVTVTTLDYASESALSGVLKKEPDKFIEERLTVDTDKFKPRGKDPLLLSRLGINPKNKIILFVGGLDSAHYFKGVDMLLHAFQKFLNTQTSNLQPQTHTLLVVGDGNLRQSYVELAQNLGILKNVVFAGSPGDHELPLFYNLADLFVFPSIDRSEAFGLVLLEALSSGVPSIASALPGVRTLIKEGENGSLVPPGDHLALAQKISDFYTHKSV